MVSATFKNGPAPDLKRRVLAAVQSEPAPTRSAVRRRTWVTFTVCTAIALAIFAQAGGIHTAARPVSLMVWTYVGWILAASAAAALGAAHGRSMLGRSTASLATLILLITGGGLYSLGVVFHLWERLPYQNAVWHVFVLAAAACHYAAILVDVAIV